MVLRIVENAVKCDTDRLLSWIFSFRPSWAWLSLYRPNTTVSQPSQLLYIYMHYLLLAALCTLATLATLRALGRRLRALHSGVCRRKDLAGPTLLLRRELRKLARLHVSDSIGGAG